MADTVVSCILKPAIDFAVARLRNYAKAKLMAVVIDEIKDRVDDELKDRPGQDDANAAWEAVLGGRNAHCCCIFVLQNFWLVVWREHTQY